jgi:hypothetical protein
MVSGLFHSPRRGAFHRSLTVLVHYRSLAVFSLGLWSAQLPARFRVSGGTHVLRHDVILGSTLRGSHPLRRPVPVAFRCPWSRRERAAVRSPQPSNPRTASPAGCTAARVWAPPRSLAATRGILSFPRGTKMFQFPRFPPETSSGPASCTRGVAPFGDPRITGCQLLPGAFRRVATSFIGRQRQGIHHALIIATFSHPAPTASKEACAPAVAFISSVTPPTPASQRGGGHFSHCTHTTPRSSAMVGVVSSHCTCLIAAARGQRRFATTPSVSPAAQSRPPAPGGARVANCQGAVTAAGDQVALVPAPVEPRGLEPRTPAVQRRCSPS